MRKFSLLVVLIFGLLLASPGLPAGAASSAAPLGAANPAEAIIAKYRTLIPQEMRKQHIPGMAIAIVDDNQVVWSEGFGFTDWDHKTPVSADTPFSIQSMSKSFTAAGVMLAVQDGLVDLDTPISQYLPEIHINSIFEERPEDKITLRHLLSHTAGFTHDAPVGNNNDLGPSTWQAHIDSIAQTWLLFPVGRRYHYANNDIDLAAHVVEVRAGIPFAQYVQKRLLDPLGMTHTSLDIDAIRAMPGRAIGHSAFFQSLPVSPIMAAGGVYTSANDMARYLRFYLSLGKANPDAAGETQVLDAGLIKDMYEGQFPASADAGYGMALGFYRSQDATNTLKIGHGGGGFGFLSDMAWYPQLNFGLVWLSNTGDHNLQSWLTDQIIGDYIDANRGTLASRASQSEEISQKPFGPQAPAILSNAMLSQQIHAQALPDSAEAVTRRQGYAGIYEVKAWGRAGELHRIGMKNKGLTLDGVVLVEVQPGLFFASDGEVLDLRGPVFYDKNVPLEKIGSGTVIFYMGLIGLGVLACLAVQLWTPIGWVWRKIRRSAPTPRPSWQSRVAGVCLFLSAFTGMVLFGVLYKFPFLLLGGMPLPTPNLPTVQAILLLSPYILLGLALIAAGFYGVEWKRKTRSERWIVIAKIGLLAAYALVVI